MYISTVCFDSIFCPQSYMEDHLKNKDRLEQEWVALCAYEAEPCATTVAQKVSRCFLNTYYCESNENCVHLLVKVTEIEL